MHLPNGRLTYEELDRLRQFDTCTLSNAVERLNIYPRIEGFINGVVTCRFPQLQPVIGYAVTARMHSSMIPVKGRCYHEHREFWDYVSSFPTPRIIVMQDADHSPGLGALFGEVHARIASALGCVACVTNGSVRDLPGIEKLGFQLFAGRVAVSHAYAHVVSFGETVEIGNLRISPGDLLHGDMHGVHAIPIEAVHELPGLAEQVLRDEREIFEVTAREDFSLDMLFDKIEASDPRRLPE